MPAPASIGTHAPAQRVQRAGGGHLARADFEAPRMQLSASRAWQLSTIAAYCAGAWRAWAPRPWRPPSQLAAVPVLPLTAALSCALANLSSESSRRARQRRGGHDGSGDGWRQRVAPVARDVVRVAREEVVLLLLCTSVSVALSPIASTLSSGASRCCSLPASCAMRQLSPVELRGTAHDVPTTLMPAPVALGIDVAIIVLTYLPALSVVSSTNYIGTTIWGEAQNGNA